MKKFNQISEERSLSSSFKVVRTKIWLPLKAALLQQQFTANSVATVPIVTNATFDHNWYCGSLRWIFFNVVMLLLSGLNNIGEKTCCHVPSLTLTASSI